MTDTVRIQITFPVGIDISRINERRLMQVVDDICHDWEADHPGRVMWAAGYGALITQMPFTQEDDEAGMKMEFDASVLSIDCAEREDYNWPCAKCGFKYKSHKEYNLDAKARAGDCEYEPLVLTSWSYIYQKYGKFK